MGAHVNRAVQQSRHAANGLGDVRTVLDAFRHIVRELRVSSRAAEAHVGLSAAQLFALHRMADGPALSVGELAERTFTHQSSVSVVVRRLVERRLVARRVSRADGRRVELMLTPAGRALLRRAPAAAQERLIAALNRLSGAERHRLARLLSRVVREMGAGGGVAGMFFEEDAHRNGGGA